MTPLFLVPDELDADEAAVVATLQESFPIFAHFAHPDEQHLERPTRAWCGKPLLGIEARGDELICGRCVMLAEEALDAPDDY